MRHRSARLTGALGLLASWCLANPATAQQRADAASAHVVIPFLANATNPADLGFEGAECETDRTGDAMDCQFQQVFLTTSAAVPDTCFVTTNRYERKFRRQPNASWISSEGPAGECGLVDVVTLQDGGGVRWTMTVRKSATLKTSPACRAIEDARETLSWENLRRPLPCRFIQPGGLSR